jgi:hypothetical protein
MIVTLHKIASATVEVDLPECCPECGQDFTEERGVVEESYIAANQPCSIVVLEGREIIDGYQSSDPVYDLPIVVGYRCGGCRRGLVSTEAGQPTGAAMRG